MDRVVIMMSSMRSVMNVYCGNVVVIFCFFSSFVLGLCISVLFLLMKIC